MAVGRDRRQYSGKMLAVFVGLSLMVAAMGGFIYGYDIGISGGMTSKEPFLEEFFPEVFTKMREDTKISNYCQFDSQLLTAFTSALYIDGLVVALLFASSVTRARTSILIGGVSFLVGSALGGAASNVYMLIFGRVLLGIGIGFATQSVPLYLFKMAPSKHRGSMNIGVPLFFAIGCFSANLINYGAGNINGGWGWRMSLSMAAMPASILTLGALFLPKLASSLIQRRNHHQNMPQSMRARSDIQAELLDLDRESSISRSISHLFKKTIQRKYGPQLVITAILFFTHFTGTTVIAFSSLILFGKIGLGESASLMSTIVTGVTVTGSTFLSMRTVHKPGRTLLLLAGGTQIFVSHIMVGGILAAQLGDHGGLSKRYGYIVLVLTFTFAAGFGWSWGPLSWLVASEILPWKIRSPGEGIAVAMTILFTSVVAETNLAMLWHFKSAIFFSFWGWVVMMTGFVYFLLPKITNRAIE